MKRITLSILALSLISNAAFAADTKPAEATKPVVQAEATKGGETKAPEHKDVKKEEKKDEKKVETPASSTSGK